LVVAITGDDNERLAVLSDNQTSDRFGKLLSLICIGKAVGANGGVRIEPGWLA
jgi:hypothetical protein